MLIFEWKNVILADIRVSTDTNDTANDVERKTL
jgi:hypothetical protein